jgi:hypothetical protein
MADPQEVRHELADHIDKEELTMTDTPKPTPSRRKAAVIDEPETLRLPQETRARRRLMTTRKV